MRRVLIVLVFAIVPATGNAQTATDREAVLKVVQLFFDTMTARDVEGWKIAGGAFTMEAKCPPSPLGPLER